MFKNCVCVCMWLCVDHWMHRDVMHSVIHRVIHHVKSIYNRGRVQYTSSVLAKSKLDMMHHVTIMWSITACVTSPNRRRILYVPLLWIDITWWMTLSMHHVTSSWGLCNGHEVSYKGPNKIIRCKFLRQLGFLQPVNWRKG